MACSRADNRNCASSLVSPQYSGSARKLRQTCGYVSVPQIEQRPSDPSAWQRTPAGLPLGNPGTGEDMDMTTQQAAQPIRQFIVRHHKAGFMVLSTRYESSHSYTICS